MSVGEWLAERGHGEMEGDLYHYPRYTHGCWGGRREALCHLCKVRYAKALLNILRRHK